MIGRDMLFEPLFAHADAKPQATAVIDDRGTWTYQQVAAMAAGLGMYLSVQTDKPTVGVLLPAGVGFVASFYGTLLSGKAVVPINFLLGDREIAHVIAMMVRSINKPNKIQCFLLCCNIRSCSLARDSSLFVFIVN